MIGTINKDATVTSEDGTVYNLAVRGTINGQPEVLVDATRVGGKGYFTKQSIEPYVGMKVNFMVSGTGQGFNYTIIQ
jgi:hypothetical protein